MGVGVISSAEIRSPELKTGTKETEGRKGREKWRMADHRTKSQIPGENEDEVQSGEITTRKEERRGSGLGAGAGVAAEGSSPAPFGDKEANYAHAE